MDIDELMWKDLTLSSSLNPPPAAAAAAAAPPPPSFSLTTTPNYSGKKRDATINDENSIDRKRKRLMKNREAAVRSRARRQAYTYELEYKVAHLVEQNAKLKKQIEKLCVAALINNDEHPKKQKLCRTYSSPF